MWQNFRYELSVFIQKNRFIRKYPKNTWIAACFKYTNIYTFGYFVILSCFKREKKLSRRIISSINRPVCIRYIMKTTFYIFQLVAHERRLSTSASRTMAAMSLGFIVMVTPWTIQEVVAACTGSKPPPFLDFLATWLALSNSFWNPFLYWLLNNHFRRISRELLYTKVK